MVKLFFGNKSFALIFLPVIIILFSILNIFLGQQKNIEGSFFGFFGNLYSLRSFFSYTLAPIIILINSLILNNIFNRNEFMKSNNFFISFMYVVTMSFFSSFYILDNFLLAQTGLILMLSQIFKLSQNKDGRRCTFNSLFFFGITCTVYPIAFFGFPFVFFIIRIFRPFVLREFFLAFIALFIPLLYANLYFFIFSTSKFNSLFFVNYLIEEYSVIIVLISFLFFYFLLGISKILNKVRSSNIRLKKLFKALFFMLFFSFSLGGVEFFAFESTTSLGLLILPLMFIIPYAFGEKKINRLATIVYYGFFFLALGKFFIPIELLKI
ncbi:MAG: hypothetical protein CL844_06945 [Crocinitomicaceae bacterium]|nr:hypothetical protein [Crocinitomicaceae bacterium]|tara:strand:- start:18011 stop:18982 length:972 start_codon:yes stop_codon:yes gene_type:complete